MMKGARRVGRGLVLLVIAQHGADGIVAWLKHGQHVKRGVHQSVRIDRLWWIQHVVADALSVHPNIKCSDAACMQPCSHGLARVWQAEIGAQLALAANPGRLCPACSRWRRRKCQPAAPSGGTTAHGGLHAPLVVGIRLQLRLYLDLLLCRCLFAASPHCSGK